MKWTARIVGSVACTAMLAWPCFGLGQEGPDWVEEGDAGSFGSNAQVTMGPGQLTGLQGNLGGVGVGSDLEDMYLIRIVDPRAFRASTSFEFGGGADFDSQIWLFQAATFDGDGGPALFGILGNDDEFGNNFGQSTITQFANDGSEAGVFKPGLYYLAITAFDNDPFSDGGEIFFQKSRSEISGPDGNGGFAPHAGWTQESGEFGNGSYRIELQGVRRAVVPAPAAFAVLAIGAFGFRIRRRD